MSLTGVNEKNFTIEQLPIGERVVHRRRWLRYITLAWVFGSAWLTATAGAPLTLFAHGLGATRFDFGLLGALPYLASFLTLVGTLIVERVGHRKAIFLIGLYVQRLMWIPAGLVPIWILYQGKTFSQSLALWSFLAMVFVSNVGQAIGGVGWTSWMADVIPARVRGKYFSRRRQWGVLSAIPTAILVGYLLDRRLAGASDQTVLQTIGLLFVCSAMFGFFDIFSFQFVPDIHKPPQRGSHFLRALAEPLKNRSFLWAVIFVALMTFALVFMNQFVTLYLIEQVHATNTQTQMMVLIVPAIAQLITLPMWGSAADRMGKKPLLALSGIGMILPAMGWSLITQHQIWIGYLVSLLGTAMWTGIEIANFNLVIELAGQDGDGDSRGSSSYVAVNTIVTNLAGFLGGLASGLIAQRMGNWHWEPGWSFKTFTYFDLLFAASGLLRLIAVVVVLPNIHEPDARPAVETLRFMAGNVYNNVLGMASQPIRVLTRRKKNPPQSGGL